MVDLKTNKNTNINEPEQATHSTYKEAHQVFKLNAFHVC